MQVDSSNPLLKSVAKLMGMSQKMTEGAIPLLHWIYWKCKGSLTNMSACKLVVLQKPAPKTLLPNDDVQLVIEQQQASRAEHFLASFLPMFYRLTAKIMSTFRKIPQGLVDAQRRPLAEAGYHF